MAGSTNQTDELSVQHAILEVMLDRRVWTNAELKKRLRSALPWTAAERTASPTRTGEYVWENRVNNALSPSRRSSLYGKGFVVDAGRGEHQITDAGARYISGDDPTLDELVDTL